MNSPQHIIPAEEAFGKQAAVFDQINDESVIINWMRKRVYAHVSSLPVPLYGKILELNAGTGIDACHFAEHGFDVLATDVSEKMLEEARRKIEAAGLERLVKTQKCSFTELNRLSQRGFDLIFSNFGGLNCAEDFSQVGRHFSTLLKPGAVVCLVMISPFCIWESLLAFKGNFGLAFRRFKKSVPSKVEGVPFTTTYFTPQEISEALGKDFRRISLKSLATFTPPPYLEGKFVNKPGLLKMLNRMDEKTEKWPLLRSAGDHFIITFQYQPRL